jgi:YidC/Oxa1 family membrane protein insertase
MQGFYSIGKNYGIAIIFISILIKIIYLPLTQKSYNSMGKMQELQPKFNELREKYRDDPQRLNKETMKLYKQYGASPFTGCLPLLLQIPVFWALFSTLRGAVELRDAVFIAGWVNDLSMPDTIANIAGFPLRILPILMTGSSLAQQFVFGTGSPGQNNKMMAFMPVFMLFIFYGMPSGLVLYWLCNDVMTFAHRYFIKQRQDKMEKNINESEGKNQNDAKNKNKAQENPNKRKK